VNRPYAILVLTEKYHPEETDLVYQSHFGENQHWHSMCPKLSGVYELCSGREDLPSGSSHPWFMKDSDLSISRLQERLTKLSMEVENE